MDFLYAQKRVYGNRYVVESKPGIKVRQRARVVPKALQTSEGEVIDGCTKASKLAGLLLSGR